MTFFVVPSFLSAWLSVPDPVLRAVCLFVCLLGSGSRSDIFLVVVVAAAASQTHRSDRDDGGSSFTVITHHHQKKKDRKPPNAKQATVQHRRHCQSFYEKA